VDYAFAPGISDQAINANRAAMSRRPATFVFDATGVRNVAEFLFSANITSGLLGAGDLLAAGHGSAEGELELPLDSTLPALTTFESVVSARASGSIKIPANLNTGHNNFYLTSCLLGSDHCRPFLVMLKQALGNPNSVGAPKFLHDFASANNGYYESMVYDFWVLGNDKGKKPLASRDQAVGRFGNGTFTFFDGTDVPAESWEQWVPPAAQLNLNTTSVTQFPFDFPVTVLFGEKLIVILKTKASWISQLDTVTFTIDSNVVPVGHDVIIDTLQTELPNKPDFASHLYPVYRRHHFNTLEDFIQGWNWQVTPSNNTLKFVGTRYKYHLWIPVTKPGTEAEWIYNFYPATGTPTINFTPDNHPYALFGIV
jgi:hypothetical protein